MKKFNRVTHIVNFIEKDEKVLDIGCTGGYQFVDPNSPQAEYSYSGDHTSFDPDDFYWLHAQISKKTNNLKKLLLQSGTIFLKISYKMKRLFLRKG